MLNFVKGFLCICWDNDMVFIFQFVNVVFHIYWFVNIEESLHPFEIYFITVNLYLLTPLPIFLTCNLSVQYSSVTQTCLTLCDSMDYSTPGFPVYHHLPKFAQTHVHWVDDVIQSSHPLPPLLLLPSISPSIRVFSNQLFTSGGQSFGASASASVLPMNI